MVGKCSQWHDDLFKITRKYILEVNAIKRVPQRKTSKAKNADGIIHSGHMTPLTFNSWYQLQSNHNGTIIINTRSYDWCREDSTCFRFRPYQYTFSGRGAKLTTHLFTFSIALRDEGWGVFPQHHFLPPHSTALKSFRMLQWAQDSCYSYTLTSFTKQPLKESCDNVRPTVQNTVWRLKTLIKK